ncbi:MAG: histidinol-phosphatase [Rhizobiaceae bacterium]
MSLPPPDELALIFNQLCDAAAAATMPLFRTNPGVMNKLDEDFDPVTEADRNAETAIRELLEKNFPEHGIVGEEFGTVRSDARFQWIIDPIDGTRAFISGIPVWGTLIGLYDDGVPIAGVMDQPFTRERYMAVDGKARLAIGGETSSPLRSGSVTALDQATLMTTSPHLLESPQDRAYFDVERRVKLFRYGCDCYAYCLLAAGQVDLVIESGLNVYDIAALIPIIEGAGGLVTSWSGGDASQGGTILAAANAELHAQAMNVLNGSKA